MSKELKELSKELKRRFCKDNSIPIRIYDETIFTDRLRLMDKYDMYVKFAEMIRDEFNYSEKEFADYCNKVMDDAIEFIKESEAYKAFMSGTIMKEDNINKFRQSDTYTGINIGRKFISIDMRKANFSSLVRYSRNNNLEFFKSFDYKEFMRKFTTNEHILNSKYIRQVIFGNCCSKRQISYMKQLIFGVLSDIMDGTDVKEEDIYSLCSDEVILYADNLSADTVAKIKEVVDFYNDNDIIPIKFEMYTLGKIKGTKAYVKKHYDREELELVCLNPLDAPFVYRFIKGETVQDNDLYFYNEGELAKFVNKKDKNVDIVYKEV